MAEPKKTELEIAEERVLTAAKAVHDANLAVLDAMRFQQSAQQQLELAQRNAAVTPA